MENDGKELGFYDVELYCDPTGRDSRVLLDGARVRGLISFTLRQELAHPPVLTMEIYTNNVNHKTYIRRSSLTQGGIVSDKEQIQPFKIKTDHHKSQCVNKLNEIIGNRGTIKRECDIKSVTALADDDKKYEAGSIHDCAILNGRFNYHELRRIVDLMAELELTNP
jgi:hypothetical protein